MRLEVQSAWLSDCHRCKVGGFGGEGLHYAVPIGYSYARTWNDLPVAHFRRIFIIRPPEMSPDSIRLVEVARKGPRFFRCPRARFLVTFPAGSKLYAWTLVSYLECFTSAMSNSGSHQCRFRSSHPQVSWTFDRRPERRPSCLVVEIAASDSPRNGC